MRTTFLFPVRPVIIVKLLVFCLTALTALLLTYSWCWHTFCKTVWLHNNRNSDDLWHQSAEDTSAHIYNQKKQACCVCGAENEPNVSLLWDTAGMRQKQKWSDLMSPNYQVDVNLSSSCSQACFIFWDAAEHERCNCLSCSRSYFRLFTPHTGVYYSENKALLLVLSPAPDWTLYWHIWVSLNIWEEMQQISNIFILNGINLSLLTATGLSGGGN